MNTPSLSHLLPHFLFYKVFLVYPLCTKVGVGVHAVSEIAALERIDLRGFFCESW